MGAIYGLYGAFAIGIVAALFGGTRTQISRTDWTYDGCHRIGCRLRHG